MKPNNSILALDIGGRRIGVALAHATARIAAPLTTLEAGEQTTVNVQKLITEHTVSDIVIGLPRNLQGEDTDQTRFIRKLTEELQQAIPGVSFHLQDEALTSKQAEAELQASGRPFKKGDIDALAATYILEDYLREHPGEAKVG